MRKYLFLTAAAFLWVPIGAAFGAAVPGVTCEVRDSRGRTLPVEKATSSMSAERELYYVGYSKHFTYTAHAHHRAVRLSLHDADNKKDTYLELEEAIPGKKIFLSSAPKHTPQIALSLTCIFQGLD